MLRHQCEISDGALQVPYPLSEKVASSTRARCCVLFDFTVAYTHPLLFLTRSTRSNSVRSCHMPVVWLRGGTGRCMRGQTAECAERNGIRPSHGHRPSRRTAHMAVYTPRTSLSTVHCPLFTSLIPRPLSRADALATPSSAHHLANRRSHLVSSIPAGGLSHSPLQLRCRLSAPHRRR